MDSVLRALVIYFVLWAIVRATGRRALAHMTAFDFILFLIVGGATQRALTGKDYSITNAVVIVVTLVALDIGMSLLETRSKRLAKVIKGVPTVLVEHGRMLHDRMRKARVTEDEILAAARENLGLEHLDEIKFAVLEASGKISIIPEERKGG